MKRHDGLLVNGKITKVSGTRTESLSSPFTGQIDRETVHCEPADIDAAVAAARQALSAWQHSTLDQRRKALNDLAAAIEARAADIAAAITAEVGTPEKISVAVQAGLPVRVLRGFAEDVEQAMASETIGHSTVTHRPLGVVAAITPWNYPLHQAMAKVGAALAAGCTVVLKPSDLVPQTNAVMMEILAAALPAGLVNVVPGDATTGAALVAHPGIDAVSFTGSVNGGRAVAEAAARAHKPCFLELGGKSAGIVLDDADFERALKIIVNGGLLNTGQTCNALTRIMVPANRLQEAAQTVADLAARMVSRLGPLISQAQYDRVQGFIARGMDDQSLTCLTGGPGRPEGMDTGYYTKPTVFLAADPGAELVQSEVFGPVLVVQGYTDDDDLIRLANGTDYGIAAALWGADEARVDAIAARLKAGQIDINGGAFNPRAPFGGFGHSGSSREMGLFGIREFQRPVSIQK
ncbi:aldehyde dehydrogenase family protein [Phaeovulum sp.]|uniref:aldehyde dehydrogenase family protein n=1 Tax=Phaeovulum sp. TaxID=2934796 RepID=UPI0039E701F8